MNKKPLYILLFVYYLAIVKHCAAQTKGVFDPDVELKYRA